MQRRVRVPQAPVSTRSCRFREEHRNPSFQDWRRDRVVFGRLHLTCIAQTQHHENVLDFVPRQLPFRQDRLMASWTLSGAAKLPETLRLRYGKLK